MNKLADHLSLPLSSHNYTLYWLSTVNSGWNAKVQDIFANHEVLEYVHKHVHTANNCQQPVNIKGMFNKFTLRKNL